MDGTILAFDPGLSPGTGYAAIRGTRRRRRPEIVEAGMIRVAGRALPEALRRLLEETEELIDELAPDAIAVELPMARGGGTLRRSATRLPSYGCAVGVCAAAAMQRGLAAAIEVQLVSVNEWTGSGRVHPTGGKLKPARIRDACALYGVRPESLGSQSSAPNVADALLIAAWLMSRLRTEARS